MSVEPYVGSTLVGEGGVDYEIGNHCYTVPVVGWAHAGEKVDYEEMQGDWRDEVVTSCRDRKAFGVWLEGDSMGPRFQEGDALILMPDEEAYSGCLAVCKFADGAVTFRRVEFGSEQTEERGDSKVMLVPLNARYPIEQFKRGDFEWIYPVFERRTMVWGGRGR